MKPYCPLVAQAVFGFAVVKFSTTLPEAVFNNQPVVNSRLDRELLRHLICNDIYETPRHH